MCKKQHHKSDGRPSTLTIPELEQSKAAVLSGTGRESCWLMRSLRLVGLPTNEDRRVHREESEVALLL
jgi:hypothetical protein